MKRALVVDDKEENRAYLSALLRGHGYEVVAAKQGAEALALARSAPPDLVITDLLMPVMDGYMLLRHWRHDERLSAIPFVVYTATYTEPEDEQLARNLGADAFVVKPVEPEELMTRIRSVETQTHRRSEANAPVGEAGLLQEYSEALVRKLEHKTIQLEEANRLLEADVAARKAVEAALRESEGSFRLLAETMPQLVWMANAAGGNVFTNGRWAAQTAMTAEQSRGEGWLDAIHPDDRARVEAAWREAVAAHSAYSLEARVRLASGGWSSCLVRALPMLGAEGHVTRWFGTCTDIQELKDTENRLRRTEEQLRHAQKMEALGRLAGGVAHDFNNLLSVILTYASLLLEELGPGHPGAEGLKQIQHASERAAALTRQLLAFSRQQVVQPKSIVLGPVMSAMTPMLARLLGEDIEITFAAAEPCGRVLADPSHLEQVLMNLAVNARDAMPRGGKLAIDVRNVELEGSGGSEPPGSRPGPYVRISIKDDGVGMDAETRARIFDPFFTTKERGKGTGLGLSIVFGIVQQASGYITVESARGRGTRFDIYLPRTDRVDDRAGPPASAPVASSGSERVLLVEDDDQLRRTMGVLLRRSGYSVIEARNGEEAVALAERTPERIDLLITDVVMPRLGGPDLAARLLSTRPALRVLFVSGYWEDVLTERALRGSAFLQKPIAPDSFLRKAREVLGR